MTLRTICLHGPESTGKSTVGPLLARHFGSVLIDEYGRTYCEEHGTDLSMVDLVAIAREQDRQVRSAVAGGALPVIVDTDALMSTVWADMLFGRRDAWFDLWTDVADVYLLFDIDLPWRADGTRMFGTTQQRQRFFDLSRHELERRGVAWMLVGGVGDDRYRNALAAIARLAG